MCPKDTYQLRYMSYISAEICFKSNIQGWSTSYTSSGQSRLTSLGGTPWRDTAEDLCCQNTSNAHNDWTKVDPATGWLLVCGPKVIVAHKCPLGDREALPIPPLVRKQGSSNTWDSRSGSVIGDRATLWGWRMLRQSRTNAFGIVSLDLWPMQVDWTATMANLHTSQLSICGL